MNIIGISDTHDSSCCLIQNGKIKFACAEERFQRIKNFGSFPIKSLKYLKEKFKLNSKNIDYIAVANLSLPSTNLLGLNSQFSIEDHVKFQEKYFYPHIYKKKNIKLSNIFPNYKFIGENYYPTNKIKLSTSLEGKGEDKKLNEMRLKYICNFFNVPKEKVLFFDHHRCHAFYAYYMNPDKSDVNVVTSDGGGDKTYETVYSVKKGKFKLIYRGRTSLIGKIYSSITLLLRMHPVRHHYKVMGLAPYTSSYNLNRIKKIFHDSLFIKGKSLKFNKNKEMKDFYFYFVKKLKIFRFDSISRGLQEFTEEILIKWFNNIYLKTKIKNFIFSGGVANNIKANKRLNEQSFVKKIFIPPGPGDENLSIGAVFSLIYDKIGYKKSSSYIKKIHNAYFAYEIDEKILENFRSNKIISKYYTNKKDFNFDKTAKKLKKGEIVAVCIGKMEFGSRALGHRSFICDPSNLKAKERLNDLIKQRDFWMPFTPSILSDNFNYYIKGESKHCNSYMTLSFDTTEIARKNLIAAIHPKDLTIRPQKVTQKTCERYYNLIKTFKKYSGIGAVLNTSLNIHEKPIIMDPIDIVQDFIITKKILIDNIYVHDTLFTLKKKYQVNKI